MKKILPAFLSLFLLSSLLLSGCESLWEWPFGGDKSDQAAEINAAVDESFAGLFDETSTAPTDGMSSLERYTNLLNAVNDSISYLYTDTAYFETSIQDYKDYGWEPYFSCSFEIYDREALYNDTMNPVGLTDEEVATLKPEAEAIFASADNAQGLCEDLAKYVTAGDYKDDDFAQAMTLVEQIYAEFDTYSAVYNQLSDDIDLMSENYNTWVVDPNDPASVGQDNMDKDSDKAGAIVDLLGTAYIAGASETEIAELQALYDELVATTATNSELSPGTDENLIYYYDDFYSVLDLSFLPTVKSALRSIKAADDESLSSDYTDTVDYYNTLIDDYNYYNDSNSY